MLILLLIATAATLEFRASVLSARAFAARARTYTYSVEDGPAPAPLPAPSGPYDLRLGYARLPAMLDSAALGGFRIVRQARPSEALLAYAGEGLAPPHPEKSVAGLDILDAQGRVLFRHASPRWTYPSFDRIPEPLWKALVWVEDRELSLTGPVTRNPAVDWDRLARAFLELGISTVDRDRRVPGGSTLATQMEKFRHSPGARTRGLRDKWRQMVSASTRAYWQGPNTVEARRRILVGYVNSVPLAAHRGWGEVTGVGEGVRLWFGADPDTVNARLHRLGVTGAGPDEVVAFAQVLSLVLAERRPSYYLRTAEGRRSLAALVEEHGRLLAEAGVISRDLGAALTPAPDTVRDHPAPTQGPAAASRAATQIRARLLPLLGIESLYDLDRLDLIASATYDSTLQAEAVTLLGQLTEPEAASALGLAVPGLLGGSDPTRVLYSILLMETRAGLNRVVVEADNAPGAASLSQSARLELGSTAKLRTLVTYLERVGLAYDRLSTVLPDSLDRLTLHPRDRWTGWLRDQLRESPAPSRETVVRRAMERRFSAHPGERFATGGGVQTFHNFDPRHDSQTFTAGEAFRHSVNLPFVRMLREIVDHDIFGPWSPTSTIFAAPDSVRRPYVERFVQREARVFLDRFERQYRDKDSLTIRQALLENRVHRPRAAARALRYVDSALPMQDFAATLSAAGYALPPIDVQAEYERADPGSFTLGDVAFLTRIHPLELWTARYRLENPGATRAAVLAEGSLRANEVYRWLLESRERRRQDPRIYAILEIDAFEGVLAQWQRLGYPFQNIVPSVGTAIGSSGDRPTALAELSGIILNGGLRYPVVRVTDLAVGIDTPYEVHLSRSDTVPTRVMDPTVAAVVAEAMVDVVENGTARRARHALTGMPEAPLRLGAKTGTGDNRSRGSEGSQPQIRNRTGTVTFFAGDRWFGVVTVYVPGETAAGYRFTSALASEVLRLFGSRIGPL